MKFAWLAAIAVFVATPAAAQQYVYTARTAAPAARQGAVVAGSLTWQCQGSACTISGPWPAPGASACAALAREVGRIVEYGRPGRVLDAAGLATCNAGLPAAQITPINPNVRVLPNVILRPAPVVTAQTAPNPLTINSSELSFVGGDLTNAHTASSNTINAPELSFVGGPTLPGRTPTSPVIDVPELSFIGR